MTSQPSDTSHPAAVSRPGISAATLEAAGIRFSDTPEPGSIEIPYHELIGKPTGFSRYRLPRERPDGQKYDQRRQSGTRAYIPPQFHAMPTGGDLVIGEGEFKALSLIEAGIKAIGLPSFNTYTRDENGEAQLLSGICEVIQHTKPDRILFLGDSDTATNYEFSRNAICLAQALRPLPVVLPRIPIGGPGKGIDDCREALGKKFADFWRQLIANAEQIDLKAKIGDLAARLLEREKEGISASNGAERVRISRRIVVMAAKCKDAPLAKDRIITFAEKVLKYKRAALNEAIRNAESELANEHRDRLASLGQPAKPSINQDANESSEPSTPTNSLLPIPPATPWSDPVNGAELLNELVDLLNRYLVLPEHAAVTLALFIIETYAKDQFDAAPYINLSSPERRCGKSLTLRLLTLLCDRVLPVTNCTEASVFRALDELEPCLMIDEVDTFFAERPQLCGILNAGNIHSEATVMRTVEVRRGSVKDYDIKQYSVFGPKVFSGIGKLPDTLADRSIRILMKRKTASESRPRFRRREFDGEPLRQKCRRWADDHAQALFACRPSLPNELNDRAADTWEPLIAIADTVGEEWPERARAAAKALSGESLETAPISLGERLLADIYKLFASGKVIHISSAELCLRLLDIDESPWTDINKGRAINPNKLAQLLKPFGVRSRKIRVSSTATAQGYDRQDFADAWKRYTPSLVAEQNNGTSPENTGETSVQKAELSLPLFRPQKPAPTNNDKLCSSVPPPRTDLVEELI